MSAAIASGITSKGSRDWTDEVEDDEEDVPIQSNENKSTSHQGDSNQREQHNQQYSRNQRDRGQRNQQSGYQRRNDRDGGGRGRGGGGGGGGHRSMGDRWPRNARTTARIAGDRGMSLR